MASVQELILAAEQIQKAKRSPFVDLVNNAVAGFDQGRQDRSRNLDATMKLMQIDQMRQEQERQAEMERQIKEQMEGQREASVTGAHTASAGAKSPVLPAQKLQVEVSQDERGRYSRKFKTSDSSTKEPGSIDAILAQRVQRGEMTLEQAIEMKAKSSPASVQFVGMQDGKPVFLNPKTQQMTTGEMPGKGPLVSTTQTEGQANAKLFSDRAEESHTQIDDLAKAVDLASASVGAQGKMPNFAKSDDVQKYEQAKRNFVNAVLRRESGAVISPAEFENANQQYFPQFGDKPGALEQKRKNRETQIAGLKNAAGIRMEDGGAKPAASGPKQVNTQAEYDALPSGAEYVDSEGNKARKR